MIQPCTEENLIFLNLLNNPISKHFLKIAKNNELIAFLKPREKGVHVRPIFQDSGLIVVQD